MTPISSNKPVFFGNNGDPLKSGYVYIGQPNKDPRTAPKTVTFEDSGGNQFTAVQPLRTNSDGRIAYNGKSIVALVDGEYSMLVLDSAQQEINGGYHPSINPVGTSGGSTGGFNELTRVGLVLDDIKSFDVSVGDMVENLGKTLAQDDVGAEWLAVSATGNPADDVDLIDFDNGLQGVRLNNKVYNKDYEEIDQDIRDGVFKPYSATVVYDATGTPSTVPTGDLSDTSPGWYIVETSTEEYSFYTRQNLGDASHRVLGNISVNSGRTTTRYLEINGGNIQLRRNLEATASLVAIDEEDTGQTIQFVYKV